MTEAGWFALGLALVLALDISVIVGRAALVHSHLARLLSQRDEPVPQIQQALIMLNSIQRSRAGLALAHTVFRLLIAGLVLYFVYQIPGATPLLAAGMLLLTAVLLFSLEWVLDGRVARNPEAWALRLAPVIRLWTVSLSPLTAVPLALSRDSQGPPGDSSSVTDEQLKSIVDVGPEEGIFERDERKMIKSIFELGDTLAREIMIPRMDMSAIDVNTPVSQALDTLQETGFSRVPVYSENVDNILGLLYAKDLLEVWRSGNPVDSLHGLLRPAYFVPEAKKVDELLAEIQRQRIHMAMIVDEYGGIAGLVTLEDIVEEILGEIQDEFDEGEELPYQQNGEGEYIFLGRVDLDDFNEIMNSHLSKDEAETLGGFLYNYFYHYFGRVPNKGESVQINGLSLTVAQVSGRRILKVHARLAPPPENIEKESSDVNG